MNRPNRPITDAGVAGLAVHEGRAELLEEIMATDVAVHPTPDAGFPRPPRRTRWLPALVAAAVLVAIGAGAVVLPRVLGDEVTVVDAPPFATPSRGPLAVLDAPGWSVRSVSAQPGYGDVSYENGDAELEIRWKVAADHDGYVASRTRIDAPKVDPGRPVTVLGAAGLLWAYGPDDHTVIRQAEGDVFLEVRGTGLDEAAYLALLDRLVAVAPADLEDHLPARFVTGAERDDAIAQALTGIPLPDALDRDSIESTEADPYHLGADVAGTVTCAWIAQYEAATETGDVAAAQEAQDALRTSRDWPVLRRMDREGDYPEVVWEISADIVRGVLPPEYDEGLGCSD